MRCFFFLLNIRLQRLYRNEVERLFSHLELCTVGPWALDVCRVIGVYHFKEFLIIRITRHSCLQVHLGQGRPTSFFSVSYSTVARLVTQTRKTQA